MQHIIKVVNPLGVKDTVTTKYMRRNEIFADAFNYFVYGGEQVINPESLEELDTREIDVPYVEKKVRSSQCRKQGMLSNRSLQ